jgi:hypothetical protein
MFARKTILALATFTTLGAAALAPTSASAWGHWGGGHWGGHWGGGGHWGHWGGWGWGHRWGGWGWAGWHSGYCAWHRCGVGYPVTYYGGGYAVPTGGPAPASAYSGPPRPGPGCLAKGYTPDGNVVFTDRCTQEGAVASSEPQPAGSPQGPPQGGPPPRR